MTAIETEEVETGEVLSLTDGNLALSAADRASIDMQVATAKKYPRSVTKALREAETLATLDEETAASMLYSLKRGGKVIPGPSVRLAEIMLYSWGNARADADIESEDARFVTAVSTCFDLERNVAVRVRSKRRITNSNGQRYNDDMIGTTSNAALSIALRNSVFRVIPRAFVDVVYRKARAAAIGKAGTITQKRQAAVEWWGKAGVTPEQIFKLLNVKGLEDIGEDELIALRGFANAVKDGEQTVEGIFGTETQQSEGAAGLNAAIGAKKGKKGESKPSEAKPTPTASGTADGDSDEAIRKADQELFDRENR